MNGSIRLISFLSMNFSGSNPFTSAAMVVEKSFASNRVIGPTPDVPARIASHVLRPSSPRRLTPPRPVTTTLRMSFLPPAPPAIRACRGLRLFLVRRDVLDHVVDGLDLLGLLIGDLDPELLLHLHHQLHDVQGVRPQVVDERRRVGYLVHVTFQLLGHDLANPLFYRHSISSLFPWYAPVEYALHVHPAVYAHHLPGHVRRSVGREENRELGDFLRGPEPSEGDPFRKLLARRLGQRLRHVRRDEPRRDRVHRDRAGSELPGHRLGEAEDPRLGRGVDRLPSVPHLTHHRAHVDDPPTPLPDHLPGDDLRNEERPFQIYPHNGVEIVLGQPHQQVIPGDPGVVHENVDPVPLRDDRLDRLIDLRRVANVEP